MKEFLQNKIKSLKDRKNEISTKFKSCEDLAKLKGYQGEIEHINTEIAEFQKQLDKLDGEQKKDFDPIATYCIGSNKVYNESNKSVLKETDEDLEKQGDFLKGYRNDSTMKSIVLDNSILVPRYQSSEVKAIPWNEVSSIMDLVNPVHFENGEAYDVPFEYEVGIAGETGEVATDGTGGEYTEVSTKFDHSSVGKAFITAYAEISKQFLKAPSARYAERVKSNIYISMRKKLARDIFIGTGGKNSIQGIFTQPKEILNDDGKTKRPNRVIGKDIEISTIDADTLDTIIFNYGGDTDVENPLVLVMNKMTLNEFSRVRDKNGNKIYNIKTNGSTFTIDDIKGVFTSHVKPFSKCADGDYFIGYGNPAAYDLAFYSSVDLQESPDYKFKQGIMCYSGDVFVGGNVTAYQSWIRVSKKAQPQK